MTDTRIIPLVSEYGIKTWDDLRLFLAVVRGGHFQGAARIMNTNQTTVARHFHRMEKALGTKLLERFGHGFKLTKSGEDILERAIAIETLMQEVNDRVRASDMRPTGTVRLSVTEGLASLWLTARLARFAEAYPDINLELIPSHGEYDMLTSGIDVAIGWGRPTELRMVGSRIGSVGFMLIASQEYVAKYGLLESLADVGRHTFLQYDTHEIQRWSTALMEQARALDRIKLRTRSISSYVAAVRAGMGIGHLPTFYRHHYPALIEMPVELSDSGDLWIVSHEETNSSRRTRLLLDFLRADFQTNAHELFS